MTYNERVRVIAEKMAIEHMTVNSWSYASISLQNWTIESMIGKAHIAVAEMAEQFKNGYSFGIMNGIGYEGYDEEKLMIDLGLIPYNEII